MNNFLQVLVRLLAYCTVWYISAFVVPPFFIFHFLIFVLLHFLNKVEANSQQRPILKAFLFLPVQMVNKYTLFPNACESICLLEHTNIKKKKTHMTTYG